MKKILLLISLSIFFTGCSKNADILASENVLPDNFEETSVENAESSYSDGYLLTKAEDQLSFEEAWKAYNFEQTLPSINFKNKSIFFLGFYESSTCPISLESYKATNGTLEITLSEKSGNCTSDAIPKSLVFSLDKSEAATIKEVKMLKGEMTSRMRFDSKP